ncbi:MAG: hypothetical protein GTN89_00990 [Acidobacteria bacterium]|nr:hypothetical protein [Acidobacteriota bacterium]NIM60753.1 hypothetical protein [Acidobacteriota bacterium]NIO57966.1 hypothetical protein [Acidobacteriota bacterium]NIQ28971.1 hypothetical protein [Acidobacteriota bacterium]NIQ83443.1 hypothetical protein [Acidobacteriota bacterium]
MRKTLFVAVMLALLGSVASAEVSYRIGEVDGGGVIIMGIIDHSDPVGIAWQPLGQIPADWILNPSGATRGDGWPSVARDPNTGYESVTWAYNAGSDFDIAYSEWDGTQWAPVEFLTASTAKELDPRVRVASDGTVAVAWWEDGVVDTVFLRTRLAGSPIWSSPVQVSQPGVPARRPSIVDHEGTIRIVYEQDAIIGQDVVVTTVTEEGYTRETVHTTARTEPLDAILHTRGSHLWLDWKESSDALGRAAWEADSWVVQPSEPWLDESWIGIEQARRSVRSKVLGVQ